VSGIGARSGKKAGNGSDTPQGVTATKATDGTVILTLDDGTQIKSKFAVFKFFSTDPNASA
jgi:hypothetical protein